VEKFLLMWGVFIAVVVDAMQRNNAEDTEDEQEKIDVINKKLDLIVENIHKDNDNFLKQQRNG
jgi:cell division protein FtsB